MSIDVKDGRVPRLLIDSCTWRHWNSHRSGKVIPQHLRVFSEAFDQVYELAVSGSITLLYNDRVRQELDGVPGLFNETIVPLSVKVPIPLSRADGAYLFDGSMLSGGVMGGSLDDFLELDGRRNQEALSAAAAGLGPGDFLYDTGPRKKEFDAEHMESALEAGADLFVTNDTNTIIKPLNRHAHRFGAQHAIRQIHAIAVTPTDALHRLQSLMARPGL